ncbi:MAG: hypothetical protein QOF61_3430 [Acidobacteriota bacterium]|jgi:hypothetical protein|nr:hypothetical protein [Acidobacteriota bacterium]
MKRSQIYGVALICGALAGVVVMIFHPTGHDLLAQSDEVARRNEMITVAVHSLALAGTPVLIFGFFGLSRRLNFDRPLVSAAFIIYSFGSVAILCAAVASGLIAPTLTREILTEDAPTQQLLHSIFYYNGLLNQGFAKVFVVASSVAVIFWSVALPNVGGLARAVRIVGIVVGLLSLVALLSGHLRLNVHGFGLFVFAQTLWTVLVGALLCRSDDSMTGV